MSADETARLAALRRYRILDTDPEPGFDDLATIAAQVCNTPIALVTLIDESRQWFKAKVGLSAAETARNLSFCTHAIERPDEITVIPNALADLRFRDNPFVTSEPGVRFYAGAPLVTPDGHALGTLCVVDSEPRSLTTEQIAALGALRRQVEAQLELRRNLIELKDALAARDRAEAEREALVVDLRHSLDNVNRLSGLMQFCSTCEINVTLPAVPSSIHKVSEGVVQMLHGKGWSEEEVIKVDLALQEALANGIRHGCKGDPHKFIQCIVTTDGDGDLAIVVRDPGPGFDPESVANPLEGDNILKSSGRGVFLINQLMDEVAFADGGREVTMRKRRETTDGA